MNPTPKTDIFLKNFDKVRCSLIDLMRFNDIFNAIELKKYPTENIKKTLTQSLIIADILSGRVTYKQTDNDIDCAADTFIVNNYESEPFKDIIKDVLINIDFINYKDVGVEFWNICPNISEMPAYIDAFRVKFRKYLKEVPTYYEFDDIILGLKNNPYTEIILKAQEKGLITKEDSSFILVEIARALRSLWDTINGLAEVFNEYKEMVGIPVQEKPHQMPKELDNDAAKAVLQRGVAAGILNENYQCLELTMYQQKEFAELASEELGIKNKWKVFETLWQIKGLAQVRMDEANLDSLKKIRDIFPDVIEREKKLRKGITKI